MDESSVGDSIASAARRRARAVAQLHGRYACGFLLGIIMAVQVLVCLDASNQTSLRQAIASGEWVGSLISSLVFGIVPTCIFSLTTMKLSLRRGASRMSAGSCMFLAALLGVGYVLTPAFVMFALKGLGMMYRYGDPPCFRILLYALGTPVVLAYVYTRLIQQAHIDGPECPGCGYLLYHAADRRCPECGRAFTVAEVDMTHAVIGEDGVLRPKQDAPDPDSNAT